MVGKGLSFVIHYKRLKAKLNWTWQELNCPKVSSER